MFEAELRPRRRLALLACCAAVALAVFFAGPPGGLAAHIRETSGLDAESAKAAASAAWRLTAIFAGVICGLMLRPFPMGPVVLLGLVLTMLTRAADYRLVTRGYGDSVTWLVVAAFVIAGGVVHTGLGRRIALLLVSAFGRTTLGLAYAISAADLLLAPVVPSNTARGGGILAPVFRSLSSALGSEPDADPRRAGSYLAFVGAQATVTTSAMFLTAMAANGLVSREAGRYGIDFGWSTWALAMIVPGLVALAAIPPVVLALYPPTLRDTREARIGAREKLRELGPWTAPEKIMAGVFALLVGLWATYELHKIKEVVVAWAGVIVLLLTGTYRYSDMVRNGQIWDALIWLGGLLSMANLLRDQGVTGWFAQVVQAGVGGLGPIGAMLVLAVVYFYAMYAFSMLTAHISAMIPPFLAVLLAPAVGAPPLATVALMAAFSNVCACLTFYSTGPVIVYFGFGFVPAGRWFALGAVVSLVHMAVWLGIGMAWWKILGWW